MIIMENNKDRKYDIISKLHSRIFRFINGKGGTDNRKVWILQIDTPF